MAKKFAILSSLVITSKSNLASANSETNSYMDWSLEQLMELKINVASKVPQTPLEAAAGISWYQQQDMERLGYHTLADLADITAGYSSTRSFGEVGLITRGQTAGAFDNNKHLLIVDGIPIHSARAYKTPVTNELPLFFADRVDFLRGPASFLYGVNAYHGLISIKPRTLTKNGTSSFFRLEHNNQLNQNAYHGISLQKTNMGSFELASSSTQRAPSRSQVGIDPDPNKLYYDDERSQFLRASYTFSDVFKGLSVGIVHIDRTTSIGEFWKGFSSPVNHMQFKSSIPYLKYQNQLSSDLRLNSYVKLNRSTEIGYWPSGIEGTLGDSTEVFASYQQAIQNKEYHGELHWQVHTNGSLILGLNNHTQKQMGASESYNGAFMTINNLTDSYSLMYDNGNGNVGTVNAIPESQAIETYLNFFQYHGKYEILDGLNLIAGLAKVASYSGDMSFSNLSPRFSIVQKFASNFSIKLLYGSALKAPGIKEFGLNSDAKAEMSRKGLDESLVATVDAETVATREFILIYWGKQTQLSLSLFASETKDTLLNETNSVIDNNGDPLIFNSYVNKGRITSNGGEFEFRYMTDSSFWIMFNHSLAWSQNEDRISPKDIPQSRSNTALGYRFNHLNSSLVAKHIRNFTGAEGNYKNKSLTSLDLLIKYHKNSSHGLNFMVKNLLNQEFYLPKGGIPTIPFQKRSLEISWELML